MEKEEGEVEEKEEGEVEEEEGEIKGVVEEAKEVVTQEFKGDKVTPKRESTDNVVSVAVEDIEQDARDEDQGGLAADGDQQE